MLMHRLVEKLREEREKTKGHSTLPSNELLSDPIEKASFLGFGEGSYVFDTCIIIGQVTAGKSVTIGPFTMLDGSGGGLTIGEGSEISVGTQIYTHDTLRHAITEGKEPTAYSPTSIGKHCYVGPHCVISKGVSLGDNCVVEASSLVSVSFPANTIIGGIPAKRIGTVELGKEVKLHYD